MADASQAIAGYLLADSGISSLVADRITPDKIDQASLLPAICYWVSAEDSEQTIQGRVGVCATRITFEAWAATRVGSNQLARALKTSLMPTDESFPIRGLIGDVNFLDVMITDGSRFYPIPRADGQDEVIYVTSQDFVFTHLE